MSDNTPETVLEFPCDFPIKAFGLASDGFPLRVLDIIRRHAPTTGIESMSSRTSGGGKYQSITITIHAENKAQLDAIYQELTASPDVIMSL